MKKFTCKYCGADIPISAKFCPKCGAYVQNTNHPLLASEKTSWYKKAKEKFYLLKCYILEFWSMFQRSSKKTHLVAKVTSLILLCALVLGAALSVVHSSQSKDRALLAVSAFISDIDDDYDLELQGDVVLVTDRDREDDETGERKVYCFFTLYSNHYEEGYSIAKVGDKYYILEGFDHARDSSNDTDCDNLGEWMDHVSAEATYELYTEYGKKMCREVPESYKSCDIVNGKFVAEQLNLRYSNEIRNQVD